MSTSPTEQAIEALLDKLQADAYDAGMSNDSMHESDGAYMAAKKGTLALLKEAKIEELALLLVDEDRSDDSPMIRGYIEHRIKALQSTEGKEI